MAPESLNERKYSSASDVWSFAVLCWEVYSYGAKPFKDLSNEGAVTAILRGTKLTKPDMCPEHVYICCASMCR